MASMEERAPNRRTATLSTLLDVLVGVEGLHIQKPDTKTKLNQVFSIVDHHYHDGLSMPSRSKTFFADYLWSSFLSDTAENSHNTFITLTLLPHSRRPKMPKALRRAVDGEFFG